MAVNCLPQRRDVLAVILTCFGKNFFQLFSTAIEQKKI